MSERNLYEVTGDIKDINTLLVSREEWNRRAQPAQAGQVLTDDFIKAEALEAFDCYWDADDETLVNKYGHGVYLSRFIDFARAVEAAVLAKRVPMTQSDLIRMSQDYADIEDEETAFRDGWRRAEIHHGIVGEKGGA